MISCVWFDEFSSVLDNSNSAVCNQQIFGFEVIIFACEFQLYASLSDEGVLTYKPLQLKMSGF